MVVTPESLTSRYSKTLDKACGYFKALLKSQDSPAWQEVSALSSKEQKARTKAASADQAVIKAQQGSRDPSPAHGHTGIDKGPALLADQEGLQQHGAVSTGNAISGEQIGDTVLHQRNGRNGIVYRATLNMPANELGIEDFKAALDAIETRPSWDNAVSSASVLEIVDPSTKMVRNTYNLGWPASARDSIMVTKIFEDDSSLLQVSSSLERGKDDPAWLRPHASHQRMHIDIWATYIQLIEPDLVRCTMFAQWDYKGTWSSSSKPFLATYLGGLPRLSYDFVLKTGSSMQSLMNYGCGLELGKQDFTTDTKNELSLSYLILGEDELDNQHQNLDLTSVKSWKRLERAIELSLPLRVGWDVQVSQHGSENPWVLEIERIKFAKRATLRISHSPLNEPNEVLSVKLTIQRLADHQGVRVNGIEWTVVNHDSRDITVHRGVSTMLAEIGTISNMSLDKESELCLSDGDPSPSRKQKPPVLSNSTSMLDIQAIKSTIARNYTYFTTLLQEPEAKWKPHTELKGVTVAKLDSLDTNLIIFRGEAVFIGIGVWDLYGVLSNYQTRKSWEPTVQDVISLDMEGIEASLLQFVYKSSWPQSARDTVMLASAYKTAVSAHIFAFTPVDFDLFPMIPRPAPSVIRVKYDLLAWAIDALSPTTTQLTLLNQSDPGGWSSTNSIPPAMCSLLTAVGEYAIKYGSPPFVMRQSNCKTKLTDLDNDKGVYRLCYLIQSFSGPADCELRIDLEKWAANLEVAIDPPPKSTKAIREHRLFQGGGGLWLTVEHEPDSLTDTAEVNIIIRRGQAQVDRGTVMVNGSKLKITQKNIGEDDAKALSKLKRTKPSRMALDHTSHINVRSASSGLASQAVEACDQSKLSQTISAPGVAVVESYEAKNAAHEAPMSGAMKALNHVLLLRQEYATVSSDDMKGWTTVQDRSGGQACQKICPAISDKLPVTAVSKVVEGYTAEEIANVVSGITCRLAWDDRVDTIAFNESYGYGCQTFVMTTKGAFPLRGRSVHVAMISGKCSGLTSSDADSLVVVSASGRTKPTSQQNPSGLPVANLILEGWILDTLDPYSISEHPIPSTRVSFFAAVDFNPGAVLNSINSVLGSSLPRLVNNVDRYLRSNGPPPVIKYPQNYLEISDGLIESEQIVWKEKHDHFGPTVLHWCTEDDARYVLLAKVAGGGVFDLMQQSKTGDVMDRVAPPSRDSGNLISAKGQEGHFHKTSSESPANRPTLSMEAEFEGLTIGSTALECLVDTSRFGHNYSITIRLYQYSQGTRTKVVPIPPDLRRLRPAKAVDLRGTIHEIRTTPGQAISVGTEGSRRNHLFKVQIVPKLSSRSTDVESESGHQPSDSDAPVKPSAGKDYLLEVSIAPEQAGHLGRILINGLPAKIHESGYRPVRPTCGPVLTSMIEPGRRAAVPDLLQKPVARTSRLTGLSAKAAGAVPLLPGSTNTLATGPVEAALNAVGLGSLVSGPISPPIQSLKSFAKERDDPVVKERLETEASGTGTATANGQSGSHGRIHSRLSRASSMNSKVGRRHTIGEHKAPATESASFSLDTVISFGGIAQNKSFIAFLLVALLSFAAGYGTKMYL